MRAELSEGHVEVHAQNSKPADGLAGHRFELEIGRIAALVSKRASTEAMIPSNVPWVILVVLALSACTDAGEDVCEPGAPGCECLMGTCMPGFVCSPDLQMCVYPTGAEDGDGGSDSPGGASEEAGDDVADPASENAPEVLSLVTDKSAFYRGDGALQVVASVSDPDGVEDVQGGILRVAEGPTLGEFLPLGATGWQVNIEWVNVNDALPAENGQLALEADFVDSAGNVGSSTIAVFTCSSEFSVCQGWSEFFCVDLKTNRKHCGECNNACHDGDYTEDENCVGGSCE